MKVRIGVSVDDDVLKQFRALMRRHKLSLSAVVQVLMEYFIDKEKEI
jgi:antitoxin component of RelBE/YafQ-DinJ toxin-antitoxin module